MNPNIGPIHECNDFECNRPILGVSLNEISSRNLVKSDRCPVLINDESKYNKYNDFECNENLMSHALGLHERVSSIKLLTFGTCIQLKIARVSNVVPIHPRSNSFLTCIYF